MGVLSILAPKDVKVTLETRFDRSEECPGSYTACMKIILAAFVAVLACALVLAVSVPDEASFHRHLAKLDQNDAEDNLLQRAGESVGRAQAKLTADYQDHTLWATVELTRGTERQRWLGVLGMWLRMSSTTDR